MVLWDSPVGTAYERGVERDDVEQATQAELFSQQEAGDAQLGPAQLRIEEKLGGIVAGLAMDIDGAREVGRHGVVEPVVIGEPTARFGDGDQIARARMAQAQLFLCGGVEDALDAGFGFNGGAHFVLDGGIVEINMRDLVIGHGEGARAAAVERLESEFVLDREPAVAAQHAIEVHRRVDLGDAVLGEHGDLNATRTEKVDEPASDVVDEPKIVGDLGIVRAEALQVVVEVRQVNEVECGPVLLLDPARGGGDPARRVDAGGRGPQKLGKGNSPRSALISGRNVSGPV